ncbi:hypothetical protein L3X38_036157 [Prunus dulcis]|uniref:RNase H type-1 domain-containing protein n=1 Tax=Prunus dulcis TaxID=3755 RepID=A0AAD4YPC8_PRUDU|nr:hypothetical protein L3X38_036157 [Prunus dulcis]
MESCSPSPRATVIASSSAISDFSRAKAHMVATRGPSAPLEQRIHTWCPPFAPKFKINIDAAWYVDSQQGGICLIARNHLGSFIAAKACPCSANSALEAEALAAVEACFFAIEHQFRQVQLEIDCREVIRGVQGNISRGQWELYPFLCKIKEHLDHPNFVDTSWAWCPRTANVVADDTATLASARMNLVTWVNKPPSSLVHVLNNDGLPCPHFLVACLQSARLDDVALVTGKWNWNWELIRMINGDMALDVTLEGIVL